MQEMFCLQCHSIGSARDRTLPMTIALVALAGGCIDALIVQWLLMLPVALIGILIFLLFESWFRVCGKCGSVKILPADSPRARKMLAGYGLDYREYWMRSNLAGKEKGEAKASPR